MERSAQNRKTKSVIWHFIYRRPEKLEVFPWLSKILYVETRCVLAMEQFLIGNQKEKRLNRKILIFIFLDSKVFYEIWRWNPSHFYLMQSGRFFLRNSIRLIGLVLSYVAYVADFWDCYKLAHIFWQRRKKFKYFIRAIAFTF